MRNTSGSRAATAGRKYFDRQYYAEDVCAELHKVWNTIYLTLDDDPLTTTEQLTLFYEHSDKVHGAREDGYSAIANARTDAEARREAAKLRKHSADLVAGYHQAERDRADDEAELHREVVRQCPHLIGRPYLLIGGWVIDGQTQEEIDAEAEPPPRARTRHRNSGPGDAKPRPIPKPALKRPVTLAASKPAARTMAVKFKRSFFRGR